MRRSVVPRERGSGATHVEPKSEHAPTQPTRALATGPLSYLPLRLPPCSPRQTGSGRTVDCSRRSVAATRRGLLRGQVAGGSHALLRRRRGLETRATSRWSRGEPRRRAGALLWRAWERPLGCSVRAGLADRCLHYLLSAFFVLQKRTVDICPFFRLRMAWAIRLVKR